jgi:predicted nucleic acid-binding protein
MLYLDTSVLVPLFVAEPDSAAERDWFDDQLAQTLAISDWSITEFASAMGIKVRRACGPATRCIWPLPTTKAQTRYTRLIGASIPQGEC